MLVELLVGDGEGVAEGIGDEELLELEVDDEDGEVGVGVGFNAGKGVAEDEGEGVNGGVAAGELALSELLGWLRGRVTPDSVNAAANTIRHVQAKNMIIFILNIQLFITISS
ncbi:MAG: hypothetical protein QXZ70_09340 [Candidatus Bathyarchaeia archaeon]